MVKLYFFLSFQNCLVWTYTKNEHIHFWCMFIPEIEMFHIFVILRIHIYYNNQCGTVLLTLVGTVESQWWVSAGG